MEEYVLTLPHCTGWDCQRMCKAVCGRGSVQWMESLCSCEEVNDVQLITQNVWQCATNSENKLKNNLATNRQIPWQQIHIHIFNKYRNCKLLPSPGVISSLLSRARWLSLQELSPVRNRAKRKWVGARENKETRMKENGLITKTPKKTLMQKVMKYNSTKWCQPPT